MSKVRVEVVAEQLIHSYKNEDGTHTREDYARGDVFEMEEDQALACAEGEVPGKLTVAKNVAGTMAFAAPPKTPGVSRAAVRILGPATGVDLEPPRETTKVTPAPKPKTGEPDRR